MQRTQRFFKQILITTLLIVTTGFSQDLEVQSNLTDLEWVTRDQNIVLNFSRSVLPDEGRITVFLGATDLTGLFIRNENLWTYSPTIIRLPSGQSDLIISLVSPDGYWQEVTRFQLRVLTRAGLEKSNISSNISITNSGQIAEGHNPEENNPARETYQDFNGQANVTSEHSRSGFTLRSNWEFVGADKRTQALRFSEKGDDASKIDLSSYLLSFEKGNTSLGMGTVQHGRQKHLINYFGSRGLLFKTQFGNWLDLSSAAMNATKNVGWSNFTGLSEAEHRVYSGTIGLNVLQNQSTTLRLEGSAVDASSLPRSNFNQGAITDAEESQGFGVKLEASGLSQRISFEGGFASSKFVNPEDPFLAQEEDVIEVKAETKNAQYANLNLGIIQNLTLSDSWFADMSLNLRHERVDPLYRSLTAYTQSDYLENAADLQTSIGMISILVSHNRSEDNLDEIESILKTKTRSNALSVSLPFPYIFTGEAGSNQFLPSFNYSFNRVHQFGEGLPVNGGFSEGHVPDQMSTSHNGGLDWQTSKWRLGYMVSYSLQDNRQPGREEADFENFSLSIGFGWTPWNRLNLGVDVGLDNAENKEIERTDNTKMFGFNMSLQTSVNSNFTFNYSTTNIKDKAQTSEQTSGNLNAQWSINFHLKRSPEKNWVQGQLFIRYARFSSDSRDFLFDFQDEFNNWTLNTGVNFTLF